MSTKGHAYECSIRFTYNSLKLKTTQNSIKNKKKLNRLWYIHTLKYCVTMEKETTMYIKDIKLSWKTLTQNSILHGSIKFKNRENSTLVTVLGQVISFKGVVLTGEGRGLLYRHKNILHWLGCWVALVCIREHSLYN